MCSVGRTFTRVAVENFLADLVKNPTLAGADACAFWRGVRFLDIQGGGNSQRDMLALFSNALQKQCGFTTAQCGGANPHAFIYLDDVLFTGNRIQRDLAGWIASDAPSIRQPFTSSPLVCTAGGHFYARGRIESGSKGRRQNYLSFLVAGDRHGRPQEPHQYFGRIAPHHHSERSTHTSLCGGTWVCSNAPCAWKYRGERVLLFRTRPGAS